MVKMKRRAQCPDHYKFITMFNSLPPLAPPPLPAVADMAFAVNQKMILMRCACVFLKTCQCQTLNSCVCVRAPATLKTVDLFCDRWLSSSVVAATVAALQ